MKPHARQAALMGSRPYPLTRRVVPLDRDIPRSSEEYRAQTPQRRALNGPSGFVD